MTHKYTLNRNLARDILGWLPDEFEHHIPNPVTLDWVTKVFNAFPSGVDPERTLKVFDMYYGLSDGIPRTGKCIGEQFGHGYTASWANKQVQKVLIAVSRYIWNEERKREKGVSNIRVYWTGNGDSVEEAIIAIQNIRTEDDKLIPFDMQWRAVVDAVNERNDYMAKIKND